MENNNEFKKQLGGYWKIIWRNNHYAAVLCSQIIMAGMAVLSKASMAKGMNPYVFVVYRQAFATAALAPFAYFIERSNSAKLTPAIVCKIFFLSLWGITLSLIMFYLALHYVSATFASAFVNTIPPVTFILAVCLRVEKVSLRQKHGLLKTLGSLIGLSGAFILIFLKGPTMIVPTGGTTHLDESTRVYSVADTLKGSLLLALNVFSYSSWTIMQGPIIREYPSSLRLTTLQCFFSCITSAIWTIGYEKNNASWELHWDMNLVSVLYCGVLSAGFSYFLVIYVFGKKGPVFPSLFTPVSLILTAVCSTTFFKEIIHWGTFCGAMLLVIGLYGILWGKLIEEKKRKLEKGEENKANVQLSEEKEGSKELNCIITSKRVSEEKEGSTELNCISTSK